MALRSPAAPRWSSLQRGIVLCFGLVVLAGCGMPDGGLTRTAPARVPNMGASPAVQRPGPPLAPATPVLAMPTATERKVANPALLAALRETQTLTINDGWWVYGPIQTMKMAFTLRREGESFAGSGTYAATSYYGPKNATTRQITIPNSAMVTFFALLADAPLREGAYSPSVTHSDDSPDIRIEAQTSTGPVSFVSQSQGEEHVPWGAIIAGNSYVVDSPQPARALAILEPYLRRDETIKSLSAAIEATVAARPTPTPITPSLCRTPTAGQPSPTAVVLPSPAPDAPHVVPGAQQRVGDVINLATYFGLPGSDFLAVGGNFAPFSLNDRQSIAPLVAALDREDVVGAPILGRPQDDLNSLTFDVAGKPVVLSYSVERGLITFGVDGQSYVTPAAPSFKSLLAQLVCSRPR